jgi:hypothetical protein
MAGGRGGSVPIGIRCCSSWCVAVRIRSILGREMVRLRHCCTATNLSLCARLRGSCCPSSRRRRGVHTSWHNRTVCCWQGARKPSVHVAQHAGAVWSGSTAIQAACTVGIHWGMRNNHATILTRRWDARWWRQQPTRMGAGVVAPETNCGTSAQSL